MNRAIVRVLEVRLLRYSLIFMIFFPVFELSNEFEQKRLIYSLWTINNEFGRTLRFFRDFIAVLMCFVHESS